MNDQELPNFLLEMGEELRTQDDLCTGDPVFQVRGVRKVYVGDGESDLFEWVDEDDATVCIDEVKAQELEAGYQLCYEVPKGYRRLYYVEIHEVVTSCFTRKAAQRYLEENAHNIQKPDIYVASAYRNREWIKLRGWLMNLPTPRRENKQS